MGFAYPAAASPMHPQIGSGWFMLDLFSHFCSCLKRFWLVLDVFFAFGNDFFQIFNDFSSILWRFWNDFWCILKIWRLSEN